jgi:hypothetical protein
VSHGAASYATPNDGDGSHGGVLPPAAWPPAARNDNSATNETAASEAASNGDGSHGGVLPPVASNDDDLPPAASNDDDGSYSKGVSHGAAT